MVVFKLESRLAWLWFYQLSLVPCLVESHFDGFNWFNRTIGSYILIRIIE